MSVLSMESGCFPLPMVRKLYRTKNHHNFIIIICFLISVVYIAFILNLLIQLISYSFGTNVFFRLEETQLSDLWTTWPSDMAMPDIEHRSHHEEASVAPSSI